MKKIYSDADKTDSPVEPQKASTSRTSTTAKKGKINVISSAKTGSTSKTSKSTSSKTSSTKTSSSKTGTSKSTTSSTKSTAKNKAVEQESLESKKTSLRTKLKSDSLDNVDLEKLNEESIKARGFRGRRNQAVIVLLSVLLAITIASVAIYAAISTKKSNCYLNVRGDGSAVFLIDGKERSEFLMAKGIKGNRVVRLNTELKIESSGKYDVIFWIEIFQSRLKVGNIDLLSWDSINFERSADGKYRSRKPLDGESTYRLFTGIAITREYENTLNDQNFKMEINAKLTKR